ncbi:MAG: adenine deaminase C-terminal domain-containing protein, partial [Calditrichota bacterium]
RLSANDLTIPAIGTAANIIDVIPDQIVTGHSTATLPVKDGHWQVDLAHDIAKLVVIERHGRGGHIGKAFVRGFGMQRGALASTVAHDSHNLICIGTSDEDILAAVYALTEAGGGLVVVEGGKPTAQLALPIAGLMSDQGAAVVVKGVEALHEAAKKLGCPLSAPFMALSFLALPVIPHLKLTDRGLVDVDKFSLIELAAS